jgi:excisionase family DNA binding protein
MDSVPARGPKLLYSAPEAARSLGIGRTTLAQEIASGRLHSVKVGRRRLVPASALDEYVARLSLEAAS